ncbi:MAG TPA: glycosyltransferase [Ohtaekwangia sp.]
MADHSEPVRVLYLSYDGLTDPLGQSQILPYLCGLASQGYSITILSFEKPERFERGRENIYKQCAAAGITWKPLRYHKNPPVLSTLFDVFTLQRACVKLFHEQPYGIVHCRSYITSLVGLALKKKYGVRFIFDMRGFWADERVEGNLWPQSNFLFRMIYRFFKRKEREMIRNADEVITLTESAREEISGWQIPAAVSVIPCCVDLDLFDAERISETQRHKIRAELNIAETDFVLLYLGSLGTWYLYDEMVVFFRLLKKYRPDAKFLFLTPDADKVQPDADFIVRAVPRNEVPAYIASCNASICFIKPSFSKKGSSATKMAEVLAMNIPVVTNAGWGDVVYLENNMTGIMIIQKGKEEETVRSLLKPSDQPQKPFFKDFFALQRGVSRYASVYEKLKILMNN